LDAFKGYLQFTLRSRYSVHSNANMTSKGIQNANELYCCSPKTKFMMHLHRLPATPNDYYK